MNARCLLILLALFPAVAVAQPADVKRILRTFDFEELQLGNREDLPMHWVKVQGPNLPHYVNGRLSTDQPHSGKYSFRFDLNGGGLIYRYEPGQLKVQPGGHYRIDGFCRTTVLPNARARITAYFVDIDGRVLPGSTQHSELYAAKSVDESWKRMSIDMSAESSAAYSLVIELGLLQPVHFAPPVLGERTLHAQDIHGTAWFDDITVSQVPRVTMTTDRPGNLFRRGEPLRLHVQVDDRFTDDLSAQLVVHDATGRPVYQRSGALDMTAAESLGPSRKRTALDLPELPAGWYEASLVMSSQKQFLGSQTLSLIQLADAAPHSRPDARFGFIATSLPFEGWQELPQILPFLSAGHVKLAVWSAAGDIQEMDSSAFDTLLEKLTELGIMPTACLLDLPPALAQKLAYRGLDQPDNAAPKRPFTTPGWTELLRADPQLWQPQLAYLISRHANHLDRWQLGADGTEAFVTDPRMRRVYAKVYEQFARLVQRPDLAMPWPAWYDMDGEMPATVALSVPPAVVLPSQLPLYMQDSRGRQGHELSLSLDWLDRARYGRETQIRDAAQRVIYALAADAKRIDLPLPFTAQRDGDAITKQPQELLMILRTLISTLSGSTYRGKVPIAEGVEAFLFDRGGEGILALWDRGTPTGTRELALNLGAHPASIDLWGNVTPLMKINTRGKDDVVPVRLKLGTMPILLVGIDGQLAQLRSSIALDRPLIESSFEPHVRHIHFANSYRQSIAGTVKLRGPTGWSVNPPSFTFSLNPGEVFDREITIQMPYNMLAGTKTIAADMTVQAETNISFSVPLNVNLGLSDVGMQSLALRDGKDVVVQQMITNYGEKPINYTAFSIFPGQPRQERLVNNLGAGRTMIKRYRFNNVAVTHDLKVRVGVKESVGSRILNDEVVVQ